MAMKYVKLFENWLLTEADKVQAFDPNKPDLWPVLATTVGDAKSANMSDEFLTSIFSRALTEANRTKLQVVSGISFAKRSYYIPNLIDDELESYKGDIKTLKKYMLDLVKGQAWEYPRSGLTKQEQETIETSKSQGYAANALFANLTKSEMIDWIKALNQFKGSIEKKKDLKEADKKKGKEIFEKLEKELQARLDDSKSKQQDEITFYYGEAGEDGVGPEFLRVLLPKTSLNKDTDKIIDYICDDISNYLPEEVDPSGNLSIEANTLTFGMIMAWFNKYEKGEANKSLLSKTGKANYDTYCTRIFGPEEAADQLEFTSAVSIGGQTVKLANSRSDGTIVPVLALNKVVGTVGFAYNSYEISDTGLKSLKEKDIWTALSSAKSSIIIVGNTDTSGTPEYNKSLSVKRAEAVLAVLSKDTRFSKLKATKNVTTRGDGKQYPLAPDDKGKNQEAAASNRRVELIIDDKEASDKLKQK